VRTAGTPVEERRILLQGVSSTEPVHLGHKGESVLFKLQSLPRIFWPSFLWEFLMFTLNVEGDMMHFLHDADLSSDKVLGNSLSIAG